MFDCLINVVLMLVVLVVLIVAHEFGHFMLARRAGVTVHEFGIGFPPRIATIGSSTEPSPPDSRAASVIAQGAATGDLHVTVRDPKGGIVTNATVTARDQARAFERSTTANVEGEYRLLALPPGTYTVRVEAAR